MRVDRQLLNTPAMGFRWSLGQNALYNSAKTVLEEHELSQTPTDEDVYYISATTQ